MDERSPLMTIECHFCGSVYETNIALDENPAKLTDIECPVCYTAAEDIAEKND